MRLVITVCLLFLLANCSPLESQKVNSIIGDENISSGTTNENNTESNEQEGSLTEISFIPMDWDQSHKDSSLWNKMTYKAIEMNGESLLSKTPKDIKKFCPNYDNLNIEGRKMFWIHLISVMSRYESSFKPETSYQEAFNDAQGFPVISRGLLQLSFESARAYKCTMKTAQELHQPQINLDCGVRILNRWIDRDGVLSENVNGSWKGGARYWAVLRTYSNRNPVEKIKARTKISEVCTLN